MAYNEFTVESSKFQFRIAKCSPVELLAITAQVDFDKYLQTKELYTFALEHVEVKQGDKWVTVKTKNREVYALGLEEDLLTLQEIISYYVENVLVKAFQKSSE